MPVQSWPLAFWPDGSVKWTGLAAVAPGPPGEVLTVEKGHPSAPAVPVRCEETDGSIRIDTGALRCEICRRGEDAIFSVARADVAVCTGARLICMRERRTLRGADKVREIQEFRGLIERATVEQAGPVRAVVKLEGVHHHPGTQRFLPFILRLYFYAGLPNIRMVHTFVYDGDARRDFLAGLGLRFLVPFRDVPHNRRVWIAGDDGAAWTEPVQGVPPMLPRPRLAGDPIGINPERARHIRGEHIEKPGGVEAMPLWNRFILLQDSPDHFGIQKGCGPDLALIDAQHGRRARGTAAICDSGGGIALSVRDFWQGYPSGLAIEEAGRDTQPATMTAWLWPAGAGPSDMRHYADRIHGPEYESYRCLEWESGPSDPERSNPYGIARTSELMLWALPGGISKEEILDRARIGAQPPVLVCEPEHYHGARVFGVWSLPDRENVAARGLESRLNELLDHYVEEVERRRWYGFWHYGDVMHSYDPDRHVWRYDEGGYAWDNTECSTDIWLWYSFLRTGRADVFRLAEAMSRHNGEVDVYHIGPLAGHGSRHNVSHWGCVCKEPRISMAGGRRFCYFLTGDERMGDTLEEVCDRWPTEKTQIQVAPWWGCFCWNWVTAWERTGDERYRNKLLRGVQGVLARRPPLIAGPLFLFDPETGDMAFIEDQEPYSYHMTLPFGAPGIWMEMAGLLGHEEWADALSDYGGLWAMGPEDRRGIVPSGMASQTGQEVAIFSARLIAYAAARRSDPGLARRAWEILLKDELYFGQARHDATGETVPELLQRERGVGTTNVAAQWSLNVIQCLALIPSYLAEISTT